MSEEAPDASGDPWGRDDPPAVAEADLPPLPESFARIVAGFDTGEELVVVGGDRSGVPGAAELPEVAPLVAAGWHPLPTGLEGEEVALLPAVWPAEHRTSVLDRLPRFAFVSYGGDDFYLEPARESAEHEHWQLARSARSLGLPVPPRGRLWLLRSPWPGLSVASLFLLLRQVRDDDELGWEPSGMMEAARRVLSGSEEQAWARWTRPEAAAARAWRGRDAPGPEVDRWVALRLGPDDVERLTTPLDQDGAGLTSGQAFTWCAVTSMGDRAGADVVRHTIEWRRAGLPPDAPVGRLATVIWERQPDDVARWLVAGFTAEDVAAWEAVDLARAERWRQAGFGAREAHELVLADPTVTPEEARAFDAAGIEPSRRVRWVAAGFSAAEAREWTDLDVVSSEARVWRSQGKGPDDARSQQAAGARGHLPLGFESGWATFGPDRDDMGFGVTDPPGTRGSLAAEQPMVDWVGMPGVVPPDFGDLAPDVGLDP
ncbi:hypothetical protein [Intrasporangium sp. YIM S08009]|uniref:hypothetical protein n=1 Tax=Intrasporangium zincisolvens TaxID=3080018 RepID=UPI002B05D3B5|nr:hypothetical protein [Intrasporangium sp. YIM S08009]